MTPSNRTNPSSESHLDVPVPLLDVVGGNRPLREELLAAIARVVDSGRFLHGQEVAELEQAIATACRVPYAVGCASCSDALLLTMMALDVGPGDEVIVPSFTFFATASCIWRLGAKPVFADICPRTFNIDPASIESLVSPATKGVIPVHLFGQCAEMDKINALAARHGLFVIEDAAQAIGASRHGQPAGSMSLASCFSFYPTKNLGAMGDAGMVTTRDQAFARRVRLLAGHGMAPRYHHHIVGINSRLDTIQAAVLGVKLKRLAQWNQTRRENAARYTELFEAANLEDQIGLPVVEPGQTHIWNQYTIRVRDGRRDALRTYLADAHIGSEVYYPIALHRQECFAELGYSEGDLPNAEQAAREVLSLPNFPELSCDAQATVVTRIADFCSRNAKSAA